MTVSPSRFIPSLKKGDTIERRDLETAILASSFYFHFVNEIYYYYYYYYRCNPPSIKRAKSLSASYRSWQKEKGKKKKRGWPKYRWPTRRYFRCSIVYRTFERTSDRRHGRTRVSPSFVPLSPRVYIPYRPIDING